ncbi:DEAD/DEAH box helicase [Gracilimonas mengyeensis]|uniref:Superfamily I DNA and/or RNA helicase n=1 Tax=Gracilimonas mengyeensis TaxID=1302730 RepID=A0A521BCR7_9BACT|nr:AAA domain-containing protein [Gracilimonas mengyeensis]SMO44868.1 Superfamily I DNA and/or RNA helicase [Gracilimonas mengyeensis]
MIKKVLKQAVEAIEKEILAVRETPSTDVLFNGELEKISGEFIYTFETQNKGLRFAEEIKAKIDDKEYTVHPVEFKEKKVRLEFPKNVGNKIGEVFLEWENDYVLKKMEEHLLKLQEKADDIPQLKALLQPDKYFKERSESPQVKTDEWRNEAQTEAIEKSLKNNILYVWGPPGTGKTATLGYIIANHLRQNKRVLFVSNTNRAVDVGLLSAMDALYEVAPDFDLQKTTRFGEAALDDPRLEDILFEHQVKTKLDSRKSDAVSLSNLLANYESLQEKVDDMMRNGEEIPQKLEMETQMAGNKVDEYGGPRELEEKVEKLMSVNERSELKKKQLVATTLAKVCTSELFYHLSYDAVVVDEGSMAGIPYMLLMAAKSKNHLVVAGDPMQLPPIAITNHPKSREFLEHDIFTYVSKSESTEDLFNWHDFNPEFTCFFDVQYRMKDDLAGVISSVFYEGRLKSGKPADGRQLESGNAASVALIDTAKYNPALEQETGERGFKPINEVHHRLIEESVKRLTKNHAPDDIGIIVPFRNSVYKVRSHLWKKGFADIEVGTIHTFQGREKPVIIFDTVMSGEWQSGGKRHYSVRPFDEDKNGLSVPRLLNVAFSRSKELLVIIADMEHIGKVYGSKFLGRLLGSVKEISL